MEHKMRGHSFTNAQKCVTFTHFIDGSKKITKCFRFKSWLFLDIQHKNYNLASFYDFTLQSRSCIILDAILNRYKTGNDIIVTLTLQLYDQLKTNYEAWGGTTH